MKRGVTRHGRVGGRWGARRLRTRTPLQTLAPRERNALANGLGTERPRHHPFSSYRRRDEGAHVMEMDPIVLDTGEKQGEGLQLSWGEPSTPRQEQDIGTCTRGVCPPPQHLQEGAAPCQRPPPCWDISRDSPSSRKPPGLLGCGIGNASPARKDRLPAGGHRPARPAAPVIGVTKVFQALRCNQENFRIRECSLTSPSCREAVKPPLLLLGLLKLTSFGCVTAEQMPVPWQPRGRRLPVAAGSRHRLPLQPPACLAWTTSSIPPWGLWGNHRISLERASAQACCCGRRPVAV